MPNNFTRSDLFVKIYDSLSLLLKYIKYLYYTHRIEDIQNEIRRKKKKNIVFVISSISMWRYDKLYHLLEKDRSLNPIILPTYFPHQSYKRNEILNEIKDFCEEKNYRYINPFLESYDELKAESLSADLVVYMQPYNRELKKWRIERFWNHSLFMYTPYGTPIEHFKHFYNSLLQQLSIALFYPNDELKQLVENNTFNQGCNVYITGDECYEKYKTHLSDTTGWKLQDNKLKRIIWAPHHSILSSDSLQYSTFLQFAEGMIEIVKEFEGKIQFTLKPHPFLFDKLKDIWGEEKVNSYITKWETGKNTNITWGSYENIFRSSDGIIHDSSGFTSDYLFTMNPALYLVKGDHESYLNDYGLECFNLHYKTSEIEGIRSFLNNVILLGQDNLKEKREKFILKSAPPGDSTPEFIMYEKIAELLK